MKGIGLVLLAVLLVGCVALLLAGERGGRPAGPVPLHGAVGREDNRGASRASPPELFEADGLVGPRVREQSLRGLVPAPQRKVSVLVVAYLEASRPAAGQGPRSGAAGTEGMRRLPGVRFEVGVGWGCFDLGADPGALVAGVTDEQGSCEVVIEVPERWISSRQERLVFGRLIERGFQEGGAAAAVPVKPDEPVVLTLLARRGGSLRGIVRDASGRGVQAELALKRGGEEVAHASSGFQGQFALPFEEDGVYRVSASKLRKGTAVSNEFAIVGLAPVPGFELQLRGPGRLFGTVVDRDGRPIPELIVAAELQASALGTGGVAAATMEGSGLDEASMRTGSDGRFDLSGLRGGLFRLWAWPADGASERRSLTPKPVSSLGGELWLVLEQSLLRVRVVDAAGLPVSMTLRGDGDGLGDAFGLDVHGFFIERAHDVAGAGITRPRSELFPRWSSAEGEALAEVVPGGTYSFGVVGRDGSLVREEVTIASGAELTERTLWMAPPLKQGKVRLLPPRTRANADAKTLIATVSLAEAGVPVKSLLLESGGPGQIESLPTGCYTVRIRSLDLGSPARTDPEAAEFEIRAGEMAIVQL